MEADALVSIDLESVQAALRESPYAEFWLELRVPIELLDDQAAKGSFDSALAETNDSFSGEWGPFTHVSTTGAHGFVTMCSGVQDMDQLGRWLVVLAERFEDHGLHGVILGERSGEWPM